MRAAERAAGGRVGSVSSIGGQGSTDEVEVPLLAVALAEGVHLLELLARCRRASPGTARGRRTPCGSARARRCCPCRATTGSRAGRAWRTPRAGCRCSRLRGRPDGSCSSLSLQRGRERQPAFEANGLLGRSSARFSGAGHDGLPGCRPGGRRAEHSDAHAALQEAPSRGDWSRRPCPLQRPSGIDAMLRALLTARSAPLAGPGG